MKIKKVTMTIASSVPAQTLVQKIKEMVHQIFPNSYCECEFDVRSSPGIFIRFAIGRDKSEWKNGIIQNDPAFNTIWIYGMDKQGIPNAGYTLEASVIGLRDPKTYKTNKLQWRDIKKPSDSQAILKNLTKYFQNLHTEYQKLYSTETAARFDNPVPQKDRTLITKGLYEISKLRHQYIPIEEIRKAFASAQYILLQEDNTPYSGMFLGQKGEAKIRYAKVEPEVVKAVLHQAPIYQNQMFQPIDNSLLILQWYKDDHQTKYEINCYLS